MTIDFSSSHTLYYSNHAGMLRNSALCSPSRYINYPSPSISNRHKPTKIFWGKTSVHHSKLVKSLIGFSNSLNLPCIAQRQRASTPDFVIHQPPNRDSQLILERKHGNPAPSPTPNSRPRPRRLDIQRHASSTPPHASRFPPCLLFFFVWQECQDACCKEWEVERCCSQAG